MDKIQTTEAPQAIGPYSQAIRASGMLFVSGQLPMDPQTGKLAASLIDIQTDQALNNLEAILKAGGCSIRDIVRVDVFLKDLNDFSVFNKRYAKRFDFPSPPARQTIQVARLPLDALVEISCIAILSSS